MMDSMTVRMDVVFLFWPTAVATSASFCVGIIFFPSNCLVKMNSTVDLFNEIGKKERGRKVRKILYLIYSMAQSGISIHSLTRVHDIRENEMMTASNSHLLFCIDVLNKNTAAPRPPVRPTYVETLILFDICLRRQRRQRHIAAAVAVTAFRWKRNNHQIKQNRSE